MNTAHLHLLVNHLPVLGVLFGVLLLAWAVFRRSPQLTRAALGVFVLAGIAGLVAYLTGEPAEEAVERLSGVSETLIGQHEDAALAATFGAGLLGLLALAGLVAFRRLADLPRWFTGASLAFGLVATGMMAWTANLGGQIRHSEIRAGAVAAMDAGSHLDDD
ncbi:MAG: hypothetical protein AB7I33_05330 [Gemmatimonadales bacterium]